MSSSQLPGPRYHLVIFFAVRERSYLHFALFGLATVAMDMCFEGPAHQFISPGNPDAALQWFLPSAFMMMGMQLTFTCSVLDAHTYAPRLAKAITWFAYGIFACIPVLFFVPRLVAHIGFIVVSTPDLVLCLSAGFITMRRGYAPARIYLLSWGVFFACIGTMVLANNGVIASSLFTDQVVLRLGSAFQIVIFSLVLAKRVNLLREQVRETSERLVESQQERIAAQEEALAIKEEAAANLQRKVDERTRELHENMTKLRRLFDSLAQGVFSFGKELTVLGNWSVAAEQIFGKQDLENTDVRTLLSAPMAPWDPEKDCLE